MARIDCRLLAQYIDEIWCLSSLIIIIIMTFLSRSRFLIPESQALDDATRLDSIDLGASIDIDAHTASPSSIHLFNCFTYRSGIFGESQYCCSQLEAILL